MNQIPVIVRIEDEKTLLVFPFEKFSPGMLCGFSPIDGWCPCTYDYVKGLKPANEAQIQDALLHLCGQGVDRERIKILKRLPAHKSCAA